MCCLVVGFFLAFFVFQMPIMKMCILFGFRCTDLLLKMFGFFPYISLNIFAFIWCLLVLCYVVLYCVYDLRCFFRLYCSFSFGFPITLQLIYGNNIIFQQNSVDCCQWVVVVGVISFGSLWFGISFGVFLCRSLALFYPLALFADHLKLWCTWCTWVELENWEIQMLENSFFSGSFQPQSFCITES